MMREARPKIFHSQHGEDRWIFDNVSLPSQGVFVDVGAEDGVSGSNTYFFEKSLGWTGVCIEPNPYVFPFLTEARQCRCIQLAIGDGSRQMLYIHPVKGWSGLLDEGRGAPHPVLVRPLEEVVYESGVGRIDLLSIDTEGTELEVLSTLDLQRYAPAIVIIEWNTWDLKLNNERAVLSLFASLPYIAAHRTSGNWIFVRRNVDVDEFGGGR